MTRYVYTYIYRENARGFLEVVNAILNFLVHAFLAFISAQKCCHSIWDRGGNLV